MPELCKALATATRILHTIWAKADACAAARIKAIDANSRIGEHHDAHPNGPIEPPRFAVIPEPDRYRVHMALAADMSIDALFTRPLKRPLPAMSFTSDINAWEKAR